MRVVVIDGVTIGHPCCAVHGCQEKLAKLTNRFCDLHTRNNKLCSIVDCSEPVVEGRLACANESHLQAEERHMLHVQSRVRRPNIETVSQDHPVNDQAPVMSFIGEELFDVDNAGHIVKEDAGPTAHPSAPTSGNKRLRGQFGRRRTHNEQLIVAPCGVIVARTTFFGAEAIKTVRVSHPGISKDCAYVTHLNAIEVYRDRI